MDDFTISDFAGLMQTATAEHDIASLKAHAAPRINEVADTRDPAKADLLLDFANHLTHRGSPELLATAIYAASVAGAVNPDLKDKALAVTQHAFDMMAKYETTGELTAADMKEAFHNSTALIKRLAPLTSTIPAVKSEVPKIDQAAFFQTKAAFARLRSEDRKLGL